MNSSPAGVVIVGTVRVRPDGRTRFDTLMSTLADGTRTEPGCVGFSFGAEHAAPGAVLVQEEHADQRALDDHQAQPYVADYAAALPGLLAEDVTFRIYDVAGHRGLTVEAAGSDTGRVRA